MNRWVVLTGYAVIVATSQMLWLTYASVDSLVAPLMHTSVGNVVILSLVFPLTYIILAVPMSRWLDRNFVPAITVGASLNAFGGVMRLVLPYNFSFQVISQIVTSLGQPLILGSLSIIAVYYFEERERPLAISIGSLSIFIGIIAATSAGPYIFMTAGYYPMLLVEAIPGIVGLIMILSSLGKATMKVSLAKSRSKYRYRSLHYKLAIMMFVGMGVFDALESLVQPMLTSYDLENYAPWILTLMTLAGIFGAAVLPQFSSKYNKRRMVISVIIATSFLSLISIGFFNNLSLVTVTFAVEGFFLLAGLPILVEWSERATPPEYQGQVTNLLMLTGNGGGLVMIALGFLIQPMGNRIISLSLLAFIILLIPVLIITPSVGIGRETAI